MTPNAPDVALTSSGSAARRTPIYAVAALSFVLLLLGLALYLTQEDGPLPNSVAVLPFTNLSPNAEDAYFTAGLHAETVNQLAQVSGLNVIGLPSVLRYADSERSAREIAAELNVQTALVADVRSADGRVRITARLIEAATGRIAGPMPTSTTLTLSLRSSPRLPPLSPMRCGQHFGRARNRESKWR